MVTNVLVAKKLLQLVFKLGVKIEIELIYKICDCFVSPIKTYSRQKNSAFKKLSVSVYAYITATVKK